MSSSIPLDSTQSQLARSASYTRHKKLLDTCVYSDVTIKCHEKVFKLHKSVICLQSPFFAAACDGKFQEGETGIIHLEHDDLDAVERMVEFLYLESYCDNRKIATATGISQTVTATPEALLYNAKTYIIAEKYDIPRLKKLAATKYGEVLENEWKSSSFVASLRLIYENTPDSDNLIRVIAADFSGGNISELIKNHEFVKLFLEHGQIGLDILGSIKQPKPPKPIYKNCIACLSRYDVRPNSLNTISA